MTLRIPELASEVAWPRGDLPRAMETSGLASPALVIAAGLTMLITSILAN